MSGSSEVVHATPPDLAPGQKHRARWIVAALVLLFILNVFLLPLITLRSYHRTIADSLSRSLGHTVHLNSANLTVFPLPGLVIHDLVVEEDPSFGAEPLLRAPSVTVYLRISSLWRQRLEVSRISLDNASVNIVRDPSARWNISSLLLQASRTPTAPTAQRRASAAPRFPYIEFSDARINFKNAAEKKPLSFLNVDATVWLADPNTWRIRLAAQPARTDRDLEMQDTGTIRLEGSLTRATSLDQLPLNLHAEWSGAQLGQASRLMFGYDSGWRGDLRAEADITGDMNDLVLKSRLRVANAHRQEFTPINQLDVDALCQATYHRPLHSLDNLTCLWPTGDGHLLLTGSIPDLGNPQPRLNLEINHTPVAFALSLIGLLRSNVETLARASGTINGSFSWAPPQADSENTPAKKSPAPSAIQDQNLQASILTGHAVADNVSVTLSGIDQPVIFAALRLATPSESTTDSSSRPEQPVEGGADRPALRARARKGAPRGRSSRHGNTEPQPSLREAPTPGRPVLLLEPASFAAGAPTPMQVSGQFAPSGFTLHFSGESSLARLEPIARDLAQLHGLQHLAAKGTAQSDITFSGPWIPQINSDTEANFPAQLEGSLRLQHAELSPAWLPEPIEIASVTAQFTNQSGAAAITWSNAVISLHGIAAKGSATYVATCNNPAGCPAQVNLDFATVDAAALQSALGAGHHGEFVQAILSTVESPAPWPALDATLHAESLTIGTLKLSNVRAAVTVNPDRSLKILALDAATLGGSTHVTGSIQAASGGPTYDLSLACTGLKLTDAASLFHEKWGVGTADGQVDLNLHGYSGLAASATGDFHWTINGNWAGNWTEPAPASPDTTSPASSDTSPTLVSENPGRWTAAGTISNQSIVLTKGPAQGTIGFDRKLDLDWTGVGAPVQITAADLPVPQLASDTPSPKPTLRITGTLAYPIAAPAQAETASSRPAPRTN